MKDRILVIEEDLNPSPGAVDVFRWDREIRVSRWSADPLEPRHESIGAMMARLGARP